MQDVGGTVRRDQTDAKIADVGVTDIHRDLRVGRTGTAATGDSDRAGGGAVVVDRVIGVVGVPGALTATVRVLVAVAPPLSVTVNVTV